VCVRVRVRAYMYVWERECVRVCERERMFMWRYVYVSVWESVCAWVLMRGKLSLLWLLLIFHRLANTYQKRPTHRTRSFLEAGFRPRVQLLFDFVPLYLEQNRTFGLVQENQIEWAGVDTSGRVRHPPYSRKLLVRCDKRPTKETSLCEKWATQQTYLCEKWPTKET